MGAYRVAVVDSDPQSLAALSTIVTCAGHQLVVQAGSQSDLNQNAGKLLADVIILAMPCVDARSLFTAQRVSLDYQAPVVVVTEVLDDQILESTHGHVFAVLMKPLREMEVRAAILIACEWHREVCSLRGEIAGMQQALAERKVIERAKGIIMQHQAIDEDGAFKHLRQVARDRRMKMYDLANSIVLANDALAQNGAPPRTAGETVRPRQPSAFISR